MTEPAKSVPTYADLDAVPPHLVAQILYGSLVTHPRPAPSHSMAQNALSGELTAPFQRGKGGPGGWVFMTEPELHLGSHVLVPGLAGWRRERLPHLPTTAFVATPPDWVCEVLSPATAGVDRGPKRRIYATYDIGYLWHLEPRARLLEVFELKDGHWVLYETFAHGEDVTAPPFEAVPFALAALWPLDIASSDPS